MGRASVIFVPDPTADPIPRDWSRPLNRVVDVGIAALLLAGACVTVPLYGTGQTPLPPLPFTVVWILTVTVPLALRRRTPALVAVVVAAAFVAGQLAGMPENLVSQISPFIALYSVGAWETSRRRSVVVRAGLVAGITAWLLVALPCRAGSPAATAAGLSHPALQVLTVGINVLYLAAVIGFGETAHRSARRLAALQRRTQELSAERERSAAQAVVLERVRIARELHDVAAHHVSVIAIQAGAARRVLRRDPEQAAVALTAVENNARSAVDELHQTLRALRHPEPANEAAPAPSEAASIRGVGQIPELVDASERAGVPTTYTITGRPRQLQPAAELTLYRLAQEALANVRKHAGPGAQAEVRLAYTPAAVEIAATNSGQIGKDVAGSGLGQLGIRERVAALGGVFGRSRCPTATRCGRHCRYEPRPRHERALTGPRPPRRRPGPRPRRPPRHPGVRAGPEGRRGGG